MLSRTCKSNHKPTVSIAALTLAMVASASAATAQSIELPLSPQHWQEVRLGEDIRPNNFKFQTTDNQPLLRIESNASMSMMAIPIDIDLTKTPVLCWRWRVNRVLDKADMTERFGDDYAARLYLSVAIPESEQSLGLRLQLGLARSIWGDQVPDGAINYVWDNRQPPGTTIPNVYTDRVTMVVTESGDSKTGQWVQQRRDVRKDIARLFTPLAKPVQIALAADTDNTGETVIAEFADIRFVSVQSQCEVSP
ncbi:DUF3047 domain-containing protein [Orrella daihaiensis]|uniref:DUF3047 domain-containing protein n=1 Tax=Orrella daihaiensis TaxID=2782176 RepID=A0ABY4AIC2_9BURK|nr:DUF3047 domain-containing protein [Orrella daihaiensis]UOD50040.1 DUF3047 domain-containing protein [Orrella daihaiensis]